MAGSESKLIRCAGCGEKLPSLAGCWWRYHLEMVEVFCPKCARARVDERSDAGLMSADVIPPVLN